MSSTFIIDTDTHVNEPPDLWTSRMSAKKWGDLIPTVQWIEAKQSEYWCVKGQPLFSVGTCIMVPGPDGRPVRRKERVDRHSVIVRVTASRSRKRRSCVTTTRQPS